MKSAPAYVLVAITGPLRRKFTYHLPRGIDEISPGQRVLVPFGRSRKVGFCLGETEKPFGIDTKPVSEILDAQTYLSPELFELCLWISEYYFANSADCLSAALPGQFKSHRAMHYRWSYQSAADLPSEVSHLATPGRPVSRKALGEIRAAGRNLLKRLIRDRLISEQVRVADTGSSRRLLGYSVADSSRWQDFFRRRKFCPDPFEGLRPLSELKAEGWTDHYIRVSEKHGLIVPTYGERQDGVLEFVTPRADVSSLRLTEEQRRVLDVISFALEDGFKPYLLHGVTGSGKTLVYCHLARKVLTLGRTVLVLTPEISLSGASLAYFRGFFGSKTTILHSALTERERLESWYGIREGRFRIVVGPRSAVFAPLENLGLIIVDEEHDGSYKQDDPAPRFNGRDVAVMRAKINEVPLVLGSASPSIESYYNASKGRYQLLQLKERPGKATLPEVRIADMRTQQIRGDTSFLSFPLKKKVGERLERGEQVILYLNRRGYSPQLKCGDCGYLPECPNCRISLTYHKVGRKLSCHYCGHLRLDYESCDVCGGARLLFPGSGTQKIEEAITRLYDKAKPIRFDSDTAAGRKNGYRILSQFAEGRHNLLLGTQMVTKGLDLPGVSLVGVLSADQGLDFPDFRASEKTFARLLQVAGRSGRSENKGEVIIQTFYPDSEVIKDAAQQDYLSFFEKEIVTRRAAFYPPFCRLINFTLTGPDEGRVQQVTDAFHDRLLPRAGQANLALDVLGPSPCPLYHLRKQYRRHLLARTKDIVRFVRMLTEWDAEEARFGLPSSVKIQVDVDPDDMM